MKRKTIFSLAITLAAVFSLGACALAPTQNRGDTLKTIDEAWNDISLKVQNLATKTGSGWAMKYNPLAEVCDGGKDKAQVSFGVEADLTAPVEETIEILSEQLTADGFTETDHWQSGDASEENYTVRTISAAENNSTVVLMVGKVGGISVRVQSACVPEAADLSWEPQTELTFK